MSIPISHSQSHSFTDVENKRARASFEFKAATTGYLTWSKSGNYLLTQWSEQLAHREAARIPWITYEVSVVNGRVSLQQELVSFAIGLCL